MAVATHIVQSECADPWGIDWRGSQQERRRLLAAILRQHVGQVDSVLDIGCAAGDTTADIVQAVRPTWGWAFDISEEAIERAEDRFGYLPVSFLAGDFLESANDIPPVDLVTAILVFEYLNDIEVQDWLQAIRMGPLSNGGHLVVQRSVKPGNALGIDETVFDEQMQRGGFERLVRVPQYGRLANLDRRPVGWLTPQATAWRPLAGHILHPLVASRRVAHAAHTLGRCLLGAGAVDIVTNVYRPT